LVLFYQDPRATLPDRISPRARDAFPVPRDRRQIQSLARPATRSDRWLTLEPT
jgi:hypothetical protein